MQSFSMELFAHPTAAYRSAPFWSWNGPLERKRLERQIAVFREMGFGGFWIVWGRASRRQRLPGCRRVSTMRIGGPPAMQGAL